mmetsp:Transcript_33273/g.56560  ORF Transcript_33273/g.56560 Transcript_33273/m.56560 type:complete len:208 (-) Transcript_33273:178-801(-)
MAAPPLSAPLKAVPPLSAPPLAALPLPAPPLAALPLAAPLLAALPLPAPLLHLLADSKIPPVLDVELPNHSIVSVGNEVHLFDPHSQVNSLDSPLDHSLPVAAQETIELLPQKMVGAVSVRTVPSGHHCIMSAPPPGPSPREVVREHHPCPPPVVATAASAAQRLAAPVAASDPTVVGAPAGSARPVARSFRHFPPATVALVVPLVN